MSAKETKTERAEGRDAAVKVTETATAPVNAPKQENKSAYPKPCVYCGPSVRGVSRQYTVYTGEVPEALAEFVKEHPAAKGLIVPVARFAETRRNLGKSGTAEAILFEKIKSEIEM